MRKLWIHLGSVTALGAALLVPLAFPTPAIPVLQSLVGGIALFAAIFGILASSYILGSSFFRGENSVVTTAIGALLFGSILFTLQTAAYYLGFTLANVSDRWTLVLAFAVSALLTLFASPSPTEPVPLHPDEHPIRTNICGALLSCTSITLSSVILWNASRHATTTAIRTPWPLLPAWTLWAMAGIWLTVLLSSFFRMPRWTHYLTIASAIASLTWIPALLYTIGFGFDGFLHIASETVLQTTGTLTPHPVAYIGQYVAVTWFHRILDLPIATLDRWFVPMVATFLLPLAWIIATRRRPIGSLPLLLLPLAGWIATTPQSLAYLIGCIALLFAFESRHSTIHPFAPLILAVWAVAIHPLAGIPLAFLTAALLTVQLEHKRFRFGMTSILVISAAFSIPILFFAISSKSATRMNWDFAALTHAKTWVTELASHTPWLGNQYVLWPAWATLATRLAPLLALLISLLGLRTATATERRATVTLLLGSALLIISAITLKAAGDFAFLISYERGSYADRLFFIAALVLVVASIPGFTALRTKLAHAPLVLTLLLGVFALALPTGLAYDSLPRHDALTVGHGWSTSAADLEAVQRIDAHAGARPYTVLANQSVSAAAVLSLGFKRYAGEVFFYPIPTGGPLYETYLHMTYNDPTRDTVRDAARLGQSELVYVVVNNYWWRAETVSEAIAAIADDTWTIQNNAVRVFVFDLATSASTSSTR